MIRRKPTTTHNPELLLRARGISIDIHQIRNRSKLFFFIFFYFINLPHEGGPLAGPWLPYTGDGGPGETLGGTLVMTRSFLFFHYMIQAHIGSIRRLPDPVYK